VEYSSGDLVVDMGLYLQRGKACCSVRESGNKGVVFVP